MGSRIGTFYALAWVLPPVPELALGWVVARATTKFRQPVNLALAAFLSKASRRLAPRRPSPRLPPHSSRRPIPPVADGARGRGGRFFRRCRKPRPRRFSASWPCRSHRRAPRPPKAARRTAAWRRRHRPPSAGSSGASRARPAASRPQPASRASPSTGLTRGTAPPASALPPPVYAGALDALRGESSQCYVVGVCRDGAPPRAAGSGCRGTSPVRRQWWRRCWRATQRSSAVWTSTRSWRRSGCQHPCGRWAAAWGLLFWSAPRPSSPLIPGPCRRQQREQVVSHRGGRMLRQVNTLFLPLHLQLAMTCSPLLAARFPDIFNVRENSDGRHDRP